MAEPGAAPEPEPDQPPTGSWAPAAPLDIAAVQDTASYPRNPTAGPGASTPEDQSPDRTTQPRSPLQGVGGSWVGSALPQIPGYQVLRYVGRGGMGIVYQALHPATGRVVALKLVNPGEVDDPVSRERFAREIHALARVEHPNIVPVYDAGEWHGAPFCAMKFIPGGTLSQHLGRIRGDLRSAIWLVVKVARAVAALHGAGVLHRDLKPLNILLSDDDEPMVADFGLARWVNSTSDLTNTGRPVGTRQYMSPEQTLGRREDYTPACDIWALGIILYEVLAGERPFSDDGRIDLFYRIRFEDPPPVASLTPGVPAELEAVALKCLAKRPEDRYPTADAAAADLERWLSGEPVTATPPGPRVTVVESPPVPTPAKSRRRSRVLFASMAVLLMLAATGAAVYHLSTPPNNSAPQKTLAERVAAGGKVKLTDEKGFPLVPESASDDHKMLQKADNGFNTFSSNEAALAALADENWELPIRVEAEVAVKYATNTPVGGVYVGRRLWPGLDFKHESLVYFGVVPRPEKGTSARLLGGQVGGYWWQRESADSPWPLDDKLQPWDRGRTEEHPRFATVVIEVREKEIRGSVAGMELKPVPEDRILGELKLKKGERVGFPPYVFTPPAFGSGIGVFCKRGACVVRNLTVSKLDP